MQLSKNKTLKSKLGIKRYPSNTIEVFLTDVDFIYATNKNSYNKVI